MITCTAEYFNEQLQEGLFAFSILFLTAENLWFILLATVCHSAFMLGALKCWYYYSIACSGCRVLGRLHCNNDVLYFQRMDLGDCPKIHDLALRADFEKASHTKDYYYDIDVMHHIFQHLCSVNYFTQFLKQENFVKRHDH